MASKNVPAGSQKQQEGGLLALPSGWIRTISGIAVNLADPKESMIDIRDIAHALGKINRFTGHTRATYTVADHCVLGSRHIMPDFALEFLMHDAAEACLGDVSSPLKGLIGDECKKLEARFEAVIARKYGLKEDVRGDVKAYDKLMLRLESQVVVNTWTPSSGRTINTTERAIAEDILEMQGSFGKRYLEYDFLNRFRELAAERYLQMVSPAADRAAAKSERAQP